VWLGIEFYWCRTFQEVIKASVATMSRGVNIWGFTQALGARESGVRWGMASWSSGDEARLVSKTESSMHSRATNIRLSRQDRGEPRGREQGYRMSRTRFPVQGRRATRRHVVLRSECSRELFGSFPEMRDGEGERGGRGDTGATGRTGKESSQSRYGVIGRNGKWNEAIFSPSIG